MIDRRPVPEMTAYSASTEARNSSAFSRVGWGLWTLDPARLVDPLPDLESELRLPRTPQGERERRRRGFGLAPRFQCVGMMPIELDRSHLETGRTRADHLVVRTAVGGKPPAAFCSSHLPPMTFPARSGADTPGNVMNADPGAPPWGTVGRFGLWRLRHNTAQVRQRR